MASSYGIIQHHHIASSYGICGTHTGNSGGPSFSDQGECVGIAFQSLKHEEAENIGYVIPPPVIEHFITGMLGCCCEAGRLKTRVISADYERNGRYTGFPALGIEWQKMESPALRAALGMKVGFKQLHILL